MKHRAKTTSETERKQKDKTESVIRTAVATGNAVIWVIAQGLERAAKGKWWRRSHATYEAYVNDLTGRSASYVRRLRSGAPLALETAAQTGRVPHPSQIEETRRTQRQHGTEAAVLLFQVVSEVTDELGGKATAETLEAVRKELPPALPRAGTRHDRASRTPHPRPRRKRRRPCDVRRGFERWCANSHAGRRGGLPRDAARRRERR